MPAQSATYDSIGERFEAFTDSASQRSVETETFFHMVGDIKGKSVLNRTCVCARLTWQGLHETPPVRPVRVATYGQGLR